MLVNKPFAICKVDAESFVTSHRAVFPLDVFLLGLHGGEDRIGVLDGCA